MKQILVGFLLMFCHSAVAQYAVKGKIVDGKTKEPLAFVNIKINDNPHLGAVTDIDGIFGYKSNTKIQTLTFSYVGYEKMTIRLDTVKNLEKLVIRLFPVSLNLQPVTIKAGENPAHRIIRKVIANRKINNPENITSFKYTSYNKIVYDMVINGTKPNVDTIQKAIRDDLHGGHLLMMETTTERKYRYPNHNQETVLGTRMSGFKDFSLAFLATDFQPFSFYNDHFQLLDIKYLSPISSGSPNYYFFNIEDTLYQNQDTIFVISFRPKKGKNINGLKGVLQIHTNKYAVQNVIAEPAEQGLIDMKIQQKYVFINDTQWFPEQLNFEVLLHRVEEIEVSFEKGGKSEKAGLSMNGRCYIDSVELYANLTKRDFSIDEAIVDAEAKYQDSSFWNQKRALPLDSTEAETYRFWDSIGEELNFDRAFTFFDKLMGGKIPIKCFDLDLSKTLVMNEFEGMRWGLGLQTNERISKRVSLGGYFGYGARDKRWKYGIEGIWNINKKYEIDVKAGYQNTLLETGHTALYTGHNELFDFRSYMASQMDKIEEKTVGFGFRAFKYAKFNITLNQTQVNPLYASYVYKPDGLGDLTTYTYTGLNIGLRYAFKERFVRTTEQRLSLGTTYPIIYVNYNRGINGFLDGNFEFNKVEFRIDKSFTWRVLGESKIRMDAGIVDRPLPYGLLYTGEGSYDKKWPVFVSGYFQTMGKYEFLSDQYANVFLSHNFGSLFLRIKSFQPHFVLHHNMGWGRLSHPEYQQNIEFKIKDKGFVESGLQIDNILRLRYLSVMYFYFGVGAYYRYGAYASDVAKDNFAFKLSFTISTK